MRLRLAGFALALLLGLSVSGQARAACYEIFGCTDSEYCQASALHAASCQVLYEMRNGIYKERGYCFKTPKAIAAFGNAGCLYDGVNEVPVNTYERANVTTIRGVEKAKGWNY